MKRSTDKNPVLLVHGIWDTTAIFDRVTPYLRELGWLVYSLDLIPNDSSVGLDKLAEQVANYAEAVFGRDRPFDLVGFSMGGIVSRYYIQRLGGIERVQRFVTISSPHNGTVTAYALNLEGSLQMRPKSPFLQDLNRDAVDMLGRINFTSMWTPFDMMILPAHSSKMPVGREIELPVLVHRWMVSDRRSLNAVARVLSEPVKNTKPAQLTPQI
ncbi:esterase/lipase family protein [Phormidium sp. CCY1219]|uniref:esterase/lipase family protein n=1 Tax=Phormidium sp. CCY1219 TaxID=2886104 RepID=UPI002D1EF65D|nr:triacylglycerol lipase [Phormidium sp. CCY1219]MEB3826111.1 triacylglycerol lipase [Phormidium sp. CCY1219]